MTSRPLSALAFFLALAGLETYPLILQLGTRLPLNLGDPLLNTWILAWGVHALVSGSLCHFFDANIFFPVERSLAFSEHLQGVLPIFAPVAILSGDPVIGYNVLFILSFALSGFSMFCLAHYWTRAFWPSLVAGTLFGFAPFRFGQQGHLQILNLFWAPLALLFLDRFLRTRRWRSLAAFAGLYWLQVLSSVYLAHMLTLAVALYVGYYLVAVDRGLLRLSLCPKLLVFLGVSLVVLLPAHVPYLAVQRSWGYVRTLQETMFYTPDVLSYVSAPPSVNDLHLLPFRPVAQTAEHEKWLFPGLVLPSLILLGSFGGASGISAVRRRRLRRIFWLIMGAAFLISLGPYLVAFGVHTRIPMPYLVLYHIVPGFAAMRVPGRFALLVVLAASPLAALGAVRCGDAVRRWFPSVAGSARVLASVGLIGLFLMELGGKAVLLVRAPAAEGVPEIYGRLAAARPGPIVELPFGDDYRYVYFTTVHWQPLVNGVSGFTPPTYAEVTDALADLPARRSAEYAAAIGVKAVVLHTAKLLPEELSRWTEAETARGGLSAPAVFGTDRLYFVPPAPVTSSLVAEISTPAWLPAKGTATLPLALRTDGRLPWKHPRPQGYSSATIRWTDSRTGSSLPATASARLPLVIVGGESIDVPLEVTAPARPGAYMLEVSIPAQGISARPRVVEVRNRTLPTSSDAPRLLGAAYARPPGGGPPTTTSSGAFPVSITASNTGQAVWRARAERDVGIVGLGWRWFKDDQELGPLSGRALIRSDVFPGQSYRFQLVVPSPDEPGHYTLELGLVSDHVTRFSDIGIPAERMTVDVQPAPYVPFADVLEQLKTPARSGLRVALAVGTPHPGPGEGLRLKVTASNEGGPSAIDAYLVLEGANGARWFHTGQGLVPYRKGPWVPLAIGLDLRTGTSLSAWLSSPWRGPSREVYGLPALDGGGHLPCHRRLEDELRRRALVLGFRITPASLRIAHWPQGVRSCAETWTAPIRSR